MLPVQRAPVQAHRPAAVLRAGSTQGRPAPSDRSQENPSVLGELSKSAKCRHDSILQNKSSKYEREETGHHLKEGTSKKPGWLVHYICPVPISEALSPFVRPTA